MEITITPYHLNVTAKKGRRGVFTCRKAFCRWRLGGDREGEEDSGFCSFTRLAPSVFGALFAKKKL